LRFLSSGNPKTTAIFLLRGPVFSRLPTFPWNISGVEAVRVDDHFQAFPSASSLSQRSGTPRRPEAAKDILSLCADGFSSQEVPRFLSGLVPSSSCENFFSKGWTLTFRASYSSPPLGRPQEQDLLLLFFPENFFRWSCLRLSPLPPLCARFRFFSRCCTRNSFFPSMT